RGSQRERRWRVRTRALEVGVRMLVQRARSGSPDEVRKGYGDYVRARPLGTPRLTPPGERMEGLGRDSARHLGKWLNDLNEGRRVEVYLATCEPDRRPGLRGAYEALVRREPALQAARPLAAAARGPLAAGASRAPV